IQIRRDVKSVHLGVVSRVAYDPESSRIYHPDEHVEEARRAHAARERHNRLAHFSSPVMRRPECFTLCRMFSEITRAAAFSIRRAFSSGPASMARAPGSIEIMVVTTDLASALSPQIKTSLSMDWSRSARR